MPTLAVAVCTLDRPESLRRCLDSVARQARPPDEVLVVDASAAAPAARAELPLRSLRSSPGLTVQRNVALDATTSEVIVFVDDDCELEPDYLAELERAFDDETVVAAGGRFLNPPAPRNRLQAVLADLFGIPSTGSGRFRRSTFPTIPCDARERDVECLSGGNMALRREVAAGLRFDERLTGFGYCEDDDIARRIGREGRIRYVPEATLWHRPQRRRAGDDPAIYRSFVENAWYLRRSNWPQSRLTDAAFVWAAVGLVLRYAAERRFAAARGAAGGVVSLRLLGTPLRWLDEREGL